MELSNINFCRHENAADFVSPLRSLLWAAGLMLLLGGCGGKEQAQPAANDEGPSSPAANNKPAKNSTSTNAAAKNAGAANGNNGPPSAGGDYFTMARVARHNQPLPMFADQTDFVSLDNTKLASGPDYAACRTFARQLVIALRSRNAAQVSSMIDWTGIFTRALDQAGPGFDRQTLIRDFGTRGRPLLMTNQNFMNSEWSPLKAVRIVIRQGRPRLIMRLADDELTFQYWEMLLEKSASGAVQVSDIYSGVRSIWISQLTSDTIAVTTNGGPTESPFAALAVAVKQGGPTAALQKYQQLSPEAKRQRVIVQTTLFQAMSSGDTDLFAKAIGVVRQAIGEQFDFPTMSLAEGIYKKDLAARLKAIDQLESIWGGDGFLQYQRGEAYYSAKQWDKAFAAATEATKREPFVNLSHRLRLRSAVEMNDFDKARIAAGTYRSNFRVDWDKLAEAHPMVKKFTLSPQFKSWSKTGSAPRPYHNARYGFTLQIPEGWRPITPLMPGVKLELRSIDNRAFFEVLPSNASEPLSLDSSIAALQKAYSGRTGFKLLEGSSKLDFAGLQGKSFTFEFGKPESPFQALVATTVRGKTGFNFRGLAPADRLAAVRPEFVTILESLQIDERPPAAISSSLKDMRAGHQPNIVRKGPSRQRYEEAQPKGAVEVRFQSEVGQLLAWLALPKGPGPHPAVVYAHVGYALGQEDLDEALPFVEAGYALMMPAWRGENGNPGDHQLLYGEVNDLFSALDYIQKRPEVDPKRVYVAGDGNGAALALLAAEMSDRIPVVAAFNAPLNLREYFEIWNAHDYHTGTYPYDDKQAMLLRSPALFVKDLHSPVLIVNPQREAFLGWQARRMRAEGKKHGKTIRVMHARNLTRRTIIKPAIAQATKFFQNPVDAKTTTKNGKADGSKAAAKKTAMRTWRDASGKFEIEAELILATADTATLRKKDGIQIQVPIKNLSDEDKKYLQSQANTKE